MNTPSKNLTRTQELEHRQKFFNESTLFDSPDPMISNPLQDRFEQLMNPLLKKPSLDSSSSAWAGKIMIAISLLIILIFSVTVLLIYVGGEVFTADYDENWLFETIQVQQQVLGTSGELPSSVIPLL
jgi:hypothetical protein